MYKISIFWNVLSLIWSIILCNGRWHSIWDQMQQGFHCTVSLCVRQNPNFLAFETVHNLILKPPFWLHLLGLYKPSIQSLSNPHLLKTMTHSSLLFWDSLPSPGRPFTPFPPPASSALRSLVGLPLSSHLPLLLLPTSHTATSEPLETHISMCPFSP